MPTYRISSNIMIITIIGATGLQGSAVLNAVLAHGKYAPRAVSRNLESAASQALAARGVEVVKANLFDKESLKNAMRGSAVVFGVTNFWDPEVFPADLDGRNEIIQGKNLVDAAKEVNVGFFIWSSLPSATKESKGIHTTVYNLDNKAIIEDYLKASGVPHAILLTGWFAENLWTWNYLQRTSNGYTVSVANYWPENVQAFTWVTHDLGAAVIALLTNYSDPEKSVLGAAYPVISFRATYPQLAAAIATEIGKEVTFTVRQSEGIDELDEMYKFLSKYGWYKHTPVPEPDLATMGVQFGSMQDFVKTEILPRFA
ncbi:NmrA domain-containing protein [Mycena sanguinolenta]|uniref:NmrA domain-containing protein n=1 Tax=Mycena sanguinolenta TaxID=230812 RepID=A0A8H6Y2F9_9AGAR|nr:NmrA domain-containing protein [Mycena sanguinolenta]